ncbi:PREDICTED: protein phosphatase 1 regulatory subunit 42-like [Nicrophorus vespilloides]|uniref:Protein phosphatase 1 regulatory subunit 42-like n=1 Tax=Nicrophorus vespilloides TaxID=110193 RepID=A0ABM1MQE4_NICVS|nr:PREDICTED: protein phosphatase 1 regulatory subunit 42-like [Nicrophorus vespilloides]
MLERADDKSSSEKIKKQTHLYMQDRSMKCIPKLSSYENLCVVYLHGNRIESIENLDAAVNLTSLYLQNNQIEKLQNLGTFRRLKKLHLGHNRISVVENLSGLDNLQELHLEKQQLRKGECLCFDPRSITDISSTLQVLNISHNCIKSIKILNPLKSVRVFNASHNKLDDIEDILKTVQQWYYLYEASFTGNPVAKRHKYRENIIARTVRLELLDKKEINETTRCFIKRLERVTKVSPSVNLADLHDLPKNYPHPLQKAVSCSIIQKGLSVLGKCNADDEYVPWQALPQSLKKKKGVPGERKNIAAALGGNGQFKLGNM